MKKTDIDFSAIEQCVIQNDYEKVVQLLQGKKDKSADLFIAFAKFHLKDADGCFQHLLRAVKNKYPKAYGYLVLYYADDDVRDARALSFMKKNVKVKDAYMKYLCGRYLYYEYDNYSKALPFFVEAKKLALAEMQDNSPQARIFQLLCPFPAHTPRNLYSNVNGDMLYALQNVGTFADRNTFIDCWKNCVTYGENSTDMFRYTLIYLYNVLDNNMGLADYRNSVDAFNILQKLYQIVDEETQREYDEYYKAICDAHQEFIESERERLARKQSASIVLNNDIANQSFISFDTVLKDVSYMWQNSGPKVKNKYVIDGEEYLLYEGDYGIYGPVGSYLTRSYDNSKSKYSIRYEKYLYMDVDGSNQQVEIGYFTDSGEFVPKT